MSQIKPSHVIVSALLALVLGGCGDKNSKAVFSPESGHSSDWMLAHKSSARADVESCAECHGENYDGGVSRVSCMSAAAVSGFSCHATSPVANQTGCISCHGNGPFGTTAPNRKNAHTKHTALAGIGCDICHLNAGYGTASHAKANAAGGISRATVSLTTYSSAHAAGSASTFGYTANAGAIGGTCSQVSCHGGKVTPDWIGAIDLTSYADCIKCHEPRTTGVVSQYNDYYSGSHPVRGNLHTYHIVTLSAKCTDCHNIGILTNYQKHFGGLATKTLTSPEKTIGGLPTKIGTYTSSDKKCFDTCHTLNRPDLWIQ